MNNALPVIGLESLKQYANNLDNGPFLKGEVRGVPDEVKTNRQIELAIKLIQYYVSLWGTEVHGANPGELGQKLLNDSSLGEKLSVLMQYRGLIGALVDRYIQEKNSLFDKQIDSMNGHDVQKMVSQILIDLK